MKEITQTDYAYVAAAVASEIEGRTFFSGTICTTHEGFESELLATLIIYRHRPDNDTPGATQMVGRVADVVPVWWEFHTYDSEGEEMLNDFSFADVKPFLIGQ